MKKKHNFRILHIFNNPSSLSFDRYFPQKLIARGYFFSYYDCFYQHNPSLSSQIEHDVPISFRSSEEAIEYLREKHGLKEDELVGYIKKHCLNQLLGY